MTIRQRLDNPIVEREARTRIRAWSTPVTITLYLCLLGGFALAMFSRATSGAPDRLPGAEDMANAAFLTVSFQLVLTLLLVAGLAAGAIAGDRQRGTLDLLVLSRLRPGDLFWGKLAAALALPLALVLLSVPVLVAVFLYAGLNLGRLALTQLVTVVAAVTLGSVVTLLSALSRSSVVATATAYAAAAALYLGTALVGTIPSSGGGGGGWTAHPLLFGNPFYALKATTTAFGPAGAPLGELLDRLFLRGGTPATSGVVLQPWQLSIILQLAVAAGCALITSRLLSRRWRSPGRRRRPGRRAESPAGTSSASAAVAS